MGAASVIDLSATRENSPSSGVAQSEATANSFLHSRALFAHHLCMHYTRTNRIATASHINGEGRPVNDLQINPMAQTRNITRACDMRVRGGTRVISPGIAHHGLLVLVDPPHGLGPCARWWGWWWWGGWVGGADRANEGGEVVRERQTPRSARRFCRFRVQHSIQIA